MPQIDNATFFSTAFWTLILYTGGFLALNMSAMFTFLSSMKLVTKRVVAIRFQSSVTKRLTNVLTFFPLISL